MAEHRRGIKLVNNAKSFLSKKGAYLNNKRKEAESFVKVRFFNITGYKGDDYSKMSKAIKDLNNKIMMNLIQPGKDIKKITKEVDQCADELNQLLKKTNVVPLSKNQRKHFKELLLPADEKIKTMQSILEGINLLGNQIRMAKAKPSPIDNSIYNGKSDKYIRNIKLPSCEKRFEALSNRVDNIQNEGLTPMQQSALILLLGEKDLEISAMRNQSEETVIQRRSNR